MLRCQWWQTVPLKHLSTIKTQRLIAPETQTDSGKSIKMEVRKAKHRNIKLYTIKTVLFYFMFTDWQSVSLPTLHDYPLCLDKYIVSRFIQYFANARAFPIFDCDSKLICMELILLVFDSHYCKSKSSSTVQEIRVKTGMIQRVLSCSEMGLQYFN